MTLKKKQKGQNGCFREPKIAKFDFMYNQSGRKIFKFPHCVNFTYCIWQLFPSNIISRPSFIKKDMVADLQGAFINLAKSVEEDPPPQLEKSDVSKQYFTLII